MARFCMLARISHKPLRLVRNPLPPHRVAAEVSARCLRSLLKANPSTRRKATLSKPRPGAARRSPRGLEFGVLTSQNAKLQTRSMQAIDLQERTHRSMRWLACTHWVKHEEIRVYECVYEYGQKSGAKRAPHVLVHLLVHADLSVSRHPSAPFRAKAYAGTGRLRRSRYPHLRLDVQHFHILVYIPERQEVSDEELLRRLAFLLSAPEVKRGRGQTGALSSGRTGDLPSQSLDLAYVRSVTA